jgi:prepilin-type N-terminal cleavage/methylation domain-containing protein
MSQSNNNQAGMSLLELLVSLGILALIFAVSLSFLFLFQRQATLTYTTESLFNALKLAQSKSQTSEQSSHWGVYFETSSQPHRYIIFKGETYSGRDFRFDQSHNLPSNMQFSALNLGASPEVVFNPLTGLLENSGSVVLSAKNQNQQQRTLYFNGFLTTLEQQSSTNDTNRLKDSRHTHFDYSRSINTATESLVLTFEGGTQKIIALADYLAGGQFSWSGAVDVASQQQILAIHTHRLNNIDTQFCVHREASENSKGFKLDLSGDPNYPAFSPTLLEYNNFGSTTLGSSSFVSALIWQ